MNAENFTEFLKSNAQLYHVPYVELESLMLEFPYSQNLRLLLFAKSWLEQHPDAEANLRRAALYSTDRYMLYRFVEQLSERLAEPHSHIILQDEYLELPELPRLPVLDDSFSAPAAPPVLPIELPADPPQDPFQDKSFSPKKRTVVPEPMDKDRILEQLAGLFQDEETDQDEAQTTTEAPSAPPATFPDQADAPTEVLPDSAPPSAIGTDDLLIQALRQKLADRLNAMNQADATPPAPKPAQPAAPAAPTGAPLPKTAFSSWSGTFSADYVQSRLTSLRQALQLDANTPDPDPVDALTRQSVRENLHLASETLADLLLRQGQLQKAIEVYERLILIFPEKTAFFAAKIETIKNLEP